MKFKKSHLHLTGQCLVPIVLLKSLFTHNSFNRFNRPFFAVKQANWVETHSVQSYEQTERQRQVSASAAPMLIYGDAPLTLGN